MSAMAYEITSLTIVSSTVSTGAYQRKYQGSASLAFVRGIHRSPVNSPHKGPVTRKCFRFDYVIMTSAGCILYRLTTSMSKTTAKALHAIVHLLVLVLTVIGLSAVFKALSEAPSNVYSIHSWVGIGAVILFALQVRSHKHFININDLVCISTKLNCDKLVLW